MKKRKIKNSRFPVSIFVITLIGLLIMAGFHSGIVVRLNELRVNGYISTAVVMIYWTLVASVFTLLTRYQIRRLYELPMKQLAEAARAVARGDFSVYLPTLHTADKLDYMDVMILDFNKMVEELGSIETLKTDFFSNVSHEIKSPLATIQNCAENLQNQNLTAAQRDEYITMIRASSQRLSGLITNILRLNKLEKQNIEPVAAAYDLCQQLAECAIMFEPKWEAKQLEFTADLADRCMIEADESLLELVWNNLLSNAIKFTPADGKIMLQQKTEGENVSVTVTDTGCGMDEKTSQHMFDKFYQGDTSHATEGNGLGLTMVSRVLEIVGGRIAVTSQPGVGTSFTVTLPLHSYSEKG